MEGKEGRRKGGSKGWRDGGREREGGKERETESERERERERERIAMIG
jgi:hypothetical protein